MYFSLAVYYNSIPLEDRLIIDTSKYPANLGYTLELCAGIVDKNKSLAEIAAEEVFEECGYKVTPDSLEYIIQFRYNSLQKVNIEFKMVDYICCLKQVRGWNCWRSSNNILC